METNQSTDILDFEESSNDDLDLPILDDDEIESQETEETTVEEAEETAPFLSVRYNKEDRGLSQEEAIEYAQKGLNYDKLNERYTNLYTPLESLARANNMSIEQFVNELRTAQNSYAVSNEIESLREKYPDADEDLLRELAEQRIGNKPTPVSETEKQLTQHKAEISRQYEMFKQYYPNVDPSKLDSQVYDLMDNGLTLLEAYNIVETHKFGTEKETLNARIKELESIEEKKKKSYGNLSNTNDDATAFERFLFSDD